MSSARTLLKDGLWKENPGLVQLLGLCPLLAVTGTFVNGLGLGLATLAVLTASSLLVSATRRLIQRETRIPVYVLIIASLVTCIELIFKAWFPDLDRALGIFIPLIVTNCAIVARAEVFASRQPIVSSTLDGFAMGLGFALLLMTLGFIREIIGHGTVFAGIPSSFDGFAIVDSGWLLAILPPGAFFALGLLIAAKRWIDMRYGVGRPAVAGRTSV